MAEVDARAARGAVAAPITAIAFGKLNERTADPRLFASDGGLVDAFAEVFARMSKASAPLEPPGRPRAETSVDRSARDEENHQDARDRADGTARDGFTAHSQEPLDQRRDSQSQDRGPSNDRDRLDVQESIHVVVSDSATNSVRQPEDSIVAPEPDHELQTPSKGKLDGQSQESLPHLGLAEESKRAGKYQANRESAEPSNPTGDPSSQPETVAKGRDGLAIARDGSEAAVKDASVGQAADQGSLQSDSGDADPRDDRRRPHRQSPWENAPTNEVRSSAGGQGSSSRSSSLEIPVAAETVGSVGAESGTFQTPLANVPTPRPVANVHQLQTTAASLPGSKSTAAGGTNPRASSPLADISKTLESGSNAAARGPQSDRSSSDVVARIKLIQRVSKAFQHLGPEGGSIRIRLAPAELGAVRVEMHVQDRQVRARVVAETEAASAVLREHLPDLRARLESQGMQIERLDVETEQLEHGFDARQDADSRWQPPQQQRGSHGGFTTEQVASTPGETKSHAASADPAAAIVSSANRGVDVQL